MAPVVKFSLGVVRRREVKLKYFKVGEDDDTGKDGKGKKKGKSGGKSGAGTEIFTFKHKQRKIGIEWGWHLW